MNRHTYKKIATWAGISIISLLCLLLISALLGRADLLGYRTYCIASGSMSPTLEVGDLVYVTQGDPEVGDIALMNVDGELITHRIIGVDNGHLVTKGDANDSPDTFKDAKILGIVRFHVPYLGRLATSVRASLSDTVKVKQSIEAATWETGPATATATTGVTVPTEDGGIVEPTTSPETTTTTTEQPLAPPETTTTTSAQPPAPPETTTTTTEQPAAPSETTTTTEQPPTPPGTTTTSTDCAAPATDSTETTISAS